jgi:hypothetical protein
MNIEAMKQALEALEQGYKTNKQASKNAITALRAAIEAAEKLEPVAWAVVGDGEHGEYEVDQMLEKKSKPNFQYWEARGYSLVPLYTAPPAAQQEPEFECPRCGHCCSQRQWVGLTDEAKAVIDAARAAMDESTEAYDSEGSIKIASQIAASLSLCLDEYDRAIEAAHGIKEKNT